MSAGSRSVEEVARAATSEARALFGAARSYLWIAAENGVTGVPRCFVSPTPIAAEATIPLIDPDLCEVLAQVPSPRRVAEAEFSRDPGFARWLARLPASERPRIWLSAPLLERDGSCMGWIGVCDRVRAPFEAADEDRLIALAERVATNLGRALLVQALQANRLKDEFLEALSHEMRTPLSAILGWAEVLRTRRLEADDFARALDRIERNARIQCRLIDELLDMSALTSGRFALFPAPVELEEVVRAAVEDLRLDAERNQVTVEIEIGEPVGVWADPERLERAVANLVSNAITFAGPGATAIVALSHVADEAVIEVRDPGRGIDPELLPTLFDRLKSGSSRVRPRPGGLGLGLAIARGIVDLHGGRISAASSGPGQGACFTIRLPAIDAAQAAAHRPEARESRPLLGLKVLVVEDEEDARDMLATALEKAGAQVMSADSARRALALMVEPLPDVVVSDISMPDEDGYSLLRRLRARPREQGGSVPAIALTALGRHEDHLAALEAGFQIHLAKPVALERLTLAALALARPGRQRVPSGA